MQDVLLKIRKHKVIWAFFITTLGLTAFDWSCRASGEERLPVVAVHYDGSKYAGSESCGSCHAGTYADHLLTAHHLTSRGANAETIKGSFAPGSNEVKVSDRIVYRMTWQDSLFYQAAYVNDRYTAKAPFDIVVGSGTKGQSYLYWFKEELKQLPVSYQTAGDQWILSPGYQEDKVDFGRPVIPTCLTCHITFARNRDPEAFFSNVYDRQQVILGVDCESCHGPSWEHANFHLRHPEVQEARHMVAITSLRRQQRLDACAKCHSGLREPKKKPFSFQTGDLLADYSEASYQPEEVGKLDVHGNQYGLLTASRCFQLSPAMDCSTCHDPHQRERGDLQTFSSRCMNCHQEGESCGMKDELGAVITENCIDCHMPGLPSSDLLMQNASTGHTDSLRVRTHRIAVYEQASKEVIRFIKDLK